MLLEPSKLIHRQRREIIFGQVRQWFKAAISSGLWRQAAEQMRREAGHRPIKTAWHVMREKIHLSATLAASALGEVKIGEDVRFLGVEDDLELRCAMLSLAIMKGV
ncbi:MAG: hypothetical protein L0287_01230, partial [Anaerolineae bacterium]|nr:hypothetical protein [Anaerolineae bacterium]